MEHLFTSESIISFLVLVILEIVLGIDNVIFVSLTLNRLKDEKGLYCTICRAQALYENTKQEDPLGRVVMRRLEHIYSKVGHA